MTDLLSFSSDFPAGDEQQWRALVEKALNGGAAEKLESRTQHGVKVKPLYRESDWPSAAGASGVPGTAPFIRGARTAPDPYLPWDIRQMVSHPDPARATDLVMEALTGGASSIELYVGPGGVKLDTAADLARLLADVQLDLAPVALDGGGVREARLLAEAARSLTASAALAFNLDPLGRLAERGSGDSAGLSNAAKFAVETSSAFSNATFLRVDGRIAHEAGGTEVQELAWLAACGAEYMRALISAGMSADAASRALLFTVSLGPDFQVEIAKLRAARRIWSRIAEAFGASGPAAAMRLQGVTSLRMQSKRDAWVNILRNTAACFAGGVGGADIVTVRCFTDAMGQPGSLARRLARNTQIIAQEESNLGRVVDPAGGSWTFEKLGADLAEAAWSLFQSIESEGGLLQALKNGGFQGGVAEALAARRKAAARRKEWITGVNDFPLIGELAPTVETVDNAGAPEAAAGDLAVPAMKPARLSEPFEALRDAADAAAASGKAHGVFLAALGPLAEHSARLMYAQNFFGAGGVSFEAAAGSPAEAAEAFKASGLSVACICGADKRYAEEAVAAAAALKAAGARRVYLAGRPGDNEAAWKEAGVDEFIYVGVDLLESLQRLHAELKLEA